MSTFKRAAHRRTSKYGYNYPVSEHEVTRNDWDWVDRNRLFSVPARPVGASEYYPSYVIPNAKCPVCAESVFFYQSLYGGRVFFDKLQPPWPKHPCTDNGREVRYITEEQPIPEAHPRDWHPLFIDEIEYGYPSSLIRGHILDRYENRMVTLKATLENCEKANGISFLKFKGETRGSVSSLTEDGDPFEIPVSICEDGYELPRNYVTKIQKLETNLFFETVTQDWDVNGNASLFKDHPAKTGFKDGAPMLAIYFGKDDNYVCGEVDDWISQLLVTEKDLADFGGAAWMWDRTKPPIIIVGARVQENLPDIDWVSDSYVESTSFYKYLISVPRKACEKIDFINGRTDDGKFQSLLYLDGFDSLGTKINIPYIKKLARIREVDWYLNEFLSSAKEHNFKINFLRDDYIIEFIRDDVVVCLWLVYSSSERGLLVTLISKTLSQGARKKLRTCGVPAGDGGLLLNNNEKQGRFARWLKGGNAFELLFHVAAPA